MKLTWENVMKNRIIKMFFCVFIINIFLDFFLFQCIEDLGIKESVILLVGSYVVYWFLNLYLILIKKIKMDYNYSFFCLFGTIFCIFAFVALVLNLKNDFILFFPMMYVFSMLCTFLNWIIGEKNIK